ncbi:MAG: hypothetical protein ACRCYL_17955 [Kluyvera sp.]
MLKFRLFIRIIVGILLATLFNANAEEPSTGHFGFQERAPSMLSERFVNLRIQLAGRMPNGNDANQAIGVNVYWKTKNKNVLQGRTFDSSLMPNLPRQGNNFYSVDFYNEHAGDTPNSENIEMIFFENGFAQTGSLKGGDLTEALNFPRGPDKKGCEPSPGYFYTQFYYYRFPKGYQVAKGGDGYTCNDNGTYTIESGKEDPDVAITSFAFTHNEPICNALNTNKVTAACAGWKGNDGTLLTKDILIPSNKLDFLIIEIITFSYDTNLVSRNYWANPVQVLRFVPSPSEKGKMNLSIADSDDPGYADGFMNTGPNFEQFGANKTRRDGYGFYSWSNSNYYRGESYTEKCPNDDSNQWEVNCDYDFTSLDSLTVSLSYADSDRRPSYLSPVESGIAIQLMPTYLDPNCQNDSKNCQYPSRSVGR